jgi:pyruvate dehydrogenase E2 component (dihydrolipoamide acetyltransferase)
MATTVTMPKLGFDMAEGTLVRWVRGIGETVQKGEVLAEIETDKATVEVEASESGVVRKHLVQEGVAVPIGTPIAIIGTADEPIEDVAASAGPSPSPSPAPAPAASAPSRAIPAEAAGNLPSGQRASPLARRMAGEASLDLRTVTGSGPGGRVTKRDVAAILGRSAVAAPLATAALPPRPETDETIEPTRLRQAISRRMTGSKQQIPHFYLTADVDAAQLVRFRAEANAALPEDTRLSIHDFVVRATALALRSFPALNACSTGIGSCGTPPSTSARRWPWKGTADRRRRDTDLKSVPAISAELRSLVAHAAMAASAGRHRRLHFHRLNLGMFQVDEFIAIINPRGSHPGRGAARRSPSSKGPGRPGWRMSVTLSADHRVTDGAKRRAGCSTCARTSSTPSVSSCSAALYAAQQRGIALAVRTGRYTIFPRWLTRLRSWWWTTSPTRSGFSN